MRFGLATISAQRFDELCDLVRFAEGRGRRAGSGGGGGWSHGMPAFDHRKNLELTS